MSVDSSLAITNGNCAFLVEGDMCNAQSDSTLVDTTQITEANKAAIVDTDGDVTGGSTNSAIKNLFHKCITVVIVGIGHNRASEKV